MADPAKKAVDPEDIVRTYLRLMEQRDLEAASAHLADEVTIVFPGGRSFASLAEQVASSSGRFRGVTKTYEQVDVVSAAHRDVVYVFGTLGGEALDGSTFEGIRFIDRFVVSFRSGGRGSSGSVTSLRLGLILLRLVNDFAELLRLLLERLERSFDRGLRPRHRALRQGQGGRCGGTSVAGRSGAGESEVNRADWTGPHVPGSSAVGGRCQVSGI